MQEHSTLRLNTTAVTLYASLEGAAQRPACLVLYSGPGAGSTFALEADSLLLGRAPECDIVLDSASVSRRHARLMVSGDTVSVLDLGSANGTLVNDKPIEPSATLADGDLLRLGNLVLRHYGRQSLDALLHDRLYRQATIDAGTEVYTKRYLLDALERELRLARRSGQPLSLLCLDLDHFKQVNDRHGHVQGDRVLREAAGLLQRLVRVTDIVGRFGGEEFVVVLPDTRAARARELAERIRARMAEHEITLHRPSPEGDRIAVHRQTVSIGVAELAPGMADGSALLAAADEQLYAAKRAGRNRVGG